MLGGKLSFSKPYVVPSHCFTVLRTPTEFYNQLLRGVREAKDQVSLASLYLGGGKLESQLVDELAQSVRSPAIF